MAQHSEHIPADGLQAAGSEATPLQSQSKDWKASVLWAFRSTRVVTPTGLQPATILVKSGKIVELAPWDNPSAEASLRDYGNHVLLPGLVDTHVHINEADEGNSPISRKHWEGFRTATQAAAAGGVTTLIDMPLNCVPETTTLAALEAKRRAANGIGSVEPQAFVDWSTWGGIVGNNGAYGNEAELPALVEAGIPGFKCFLVHSGIDGFAWVDEPQLSKSLANLNELRKTHLPILAHAELAGPIDAATTQINQQNSDWRTYSTYLASRPDEAEVQAIELLIDLSRRYDTHIHIVHLSSAKALPALQRARAAGLKITVETCPHYLHFAAEEIPDSATEFKCAPPIRTAANRESLWQALLDGTIDLIATDHSPAPPEMKQQGRLDQAWGGIASLGLALPIVWTGLHHRALTSAHASTEFLAKWLCAEPARLASLTGIKGSLAPGHDADIAVFDTEPTWTVTESDLHFRHKLSPYLGANLRGRVLETYLRGECIYWYRPTPNEPPATTCGILDPQPHGQELRIFN